MSVSFIDHGTTFSNSDQIAEVPLPMSIKRRSSSLNDYFDTKGFLLIIDNIEDQSLSVDATNQYLENIATLLANYSHNNTTILVTTRSKRANQSVNSSNARMPEIVDCSPRYADLFYAEDFAVDSASDSKELHGFRQKLASLIESEPIEDGYEHPAEMLIAESLKKNKLTQTWVFSIFREKSKSNPSCCAILLRCIGRLPLHNIRDWGLVMASNGLEHLDVEVREASIRALEMWGGEDAVAILKSHTEPIGWLSKYVDQVIKDLSA